jgi:HTH-type transcriptional regulator/antitoxin HigA
LHPGVTLSATLKALEISQAELARRTGLSTKHINQIIQGKAGISPPVAIKLEFLTGVPAKFWNALDARFQDWIIRSSYEDKQRSMPDLAEYWREAGLLDSAALLDEIGGIGEARP